MRRSSIQELDCPIPSSHDWSRTHAKSINPGRQPPRVFLVGDDDAPAVEGTLFDYDWHHMNLELGRQRAGDVGWPKPTPRLRRRRIEIHEPARPFSIDVHILPLKRRHADREPPVPAHWISYYSANPNNFRWITVQDNPAPEPREYPDEKAFYATLRCGNVVRRWLGWREIKIPEATRLYREDLSSGPGMTSIELLPKRQWAVEYVLMRALWQERLVPKSEAQIGVPDTAHVEEAFEEGEWHDARAEAEWLFAFDNR